MRPFNVTLIMLLICFCYVRSSEISECDQIEKKFECMYEKFLKTYPRINATEEETAMRLGIFKKSLEEIDRKNSKSTGTKYGITMFADWTLEELKEYDRPLKHDIQRVFRGPDPWIHIIWDGIQPIPRQFDWRLLNGVTPIKRQNSRCNSCWAHAVTATVESLYKIKFGKAVILSEAELIDCDYTNNGCISGSTRRATARGLFHGFQINDAYIRTGWCHQNNPIKLKRLYSIAADDKSIAWFISNFGPVTLNVAVPLFLYKDFKGGAIMAPTYHCASMTPNHAVEAVGFGEENGIKYWILKNSWGPQWGENGYFRLQRGVNACSIESFPTSASFL